VLLNRIDQAQQPFIKKLSEEIVSEVKRLEHAAALGRAKLHALAQSSAYGNGSVALSQEASLAVKGYLPPENAQEIQFNSPLYGFMIAMREKSQIMAQAT
jgi:hypothetical protein